MNDTGSMGNIQADIAAYPEEPSSRHPGWPAFNLVQAPRARRQPDRAAPRRDREFLTLAQGRAPGTRAGTRGGRS